MGNKTLSAAKSAKNDEFYTQYNDIQKEINAYLDYDPDTFRGKTVLLPCDDPEWSKFTRFFAENFEHLGLKKLISTSYAAASKRARDFSDGTGNSSHPKYGIIQGVFGGRFLRSAQVGRASESFYLHQISKWA